jgi:hypothetical protein
MMNKDLEGAILGLGSMYRTLGEYEKSKDTLDKGIERFPNNRALQVFYHVCQEDSFLKNSTEF